MFESFKKANFATIIYKIIIKNNNKSASGRITHGIVGDVITCLREVFFFEDFVSDNVIRL